MKYPRVDEIQRFIDENSITQLRMSARKSGLIWFKNILVATHSSAILSITRTGYVRNVWIPSLFVEPSSPRSVFIHLAGKWEEIPYTVSTWESAIITSLYPRECLPRPKFSKRTWERFTGYTFADKWPLEAAALAEILRQRLVGGGVGVC